MNNKAGHDGFGRLINRYRYKNPNRMPPQKSSSSDVGALTDRGRTVPPGYCDR